MSSCTVMADAVRHIHGGQESHEGMLKDFCAGGLGRVQWEPLVHAFKADVLELVPGGSSPRSMGIQTVCFYTGEYTA